MSFCQSSQRREWWAFAYHDDGMSLLTMTMVNRFASFSVQRQSGSLGRRGRVFVQFGRWAGNAVNSGQPAAEIDLLTARRAERPESLGRAPAANGAGGWLLNHGFSPEPRPLPAGMGPILRWRRVRFGEASRAGRPGRLAGPTRRPDVPAPQTWRAGRGCSLP